MARVWFLAVSPLTPESRVPLVRSWVLPHALHSIAPLTTMATSSVKPKKRPEPFRVPNYTGIEGDKTHHLTGPFLPQTPLGGTTPTHSRSVSPTASRLFAAQVARRSALVRWVIEPALSFQILLLPLVLSINWKVLAPYVNPGAENPFSIFLISGRVPATSPDNSLYRKTWWDILFIAYYVVVFSFIRQSLSIKVSRPLAKYFGLRNENKIDRFGEQFYAVVYFSFFGAWGYRVMTQLPTYWYNTAAFWNAYPTWAMRPELKVYYLIQFAYWWQQLLVLILGLEKPRKDYWELVAHHFVTLWLVGWSYLLNLTLIGNAVYMSMDIPDVFLALSKMLNYIQWNTAKTYAFGIFFVIWTYFRHYLNLWILWSVWSESSLVPDWTKQWNWSEGVYMPGWMKYQIFLPLALLQGLNLFWYTLMFKILIRGLITRDVDDHRSDDEDDGDDDSHKKED